VEPEHKGYRASLVFRVKLVSVFRARPASKESRAQPASLGLTELRARKAQPASECRAMPESKEQLAFKVSLGSKVLPALRGLMASRVLLGFRATLVSKGLLGSKAQQELELRAKSGRPASREFLEIRAQPG
jgi:hypothetical protein